MHTHAHSRYSPPTCAQSASQAALKVFRRRRSTSSNLHAHVSQPSSAQSRWSKVSAPDCGHHLLEPDRAMSFRRVICLSLVAAAAAGSAESSNPQLRGSAVSSTTAEDQPELQCSCNQAGECGCDDALNASSVHDQEDLEFKQMLLNQTQEMHAWWLANGDHVGQLACSCKIGNETCLCESDPTVAEMPQLKSTEQPLSLWWAVAGGVRVGGWHRCGHVRAGGCRCRVLAGCGCAAGRAGGCRWR